MLETNAETNREFCWGPLRVGTNFLRPFFTHSNLIFLVDFLELSNLNFYQSNKSELKFFEQLFDFYRPIKKPSLFSFFQQ